MIHVDDLGRLCLDPGLLGALVGVLLVFTYFIGYVRGGKFMLKKFDGHWADDIKRRQAEIDKILSRYK